MDRLTDAAPELPFGTQDWHEARGLCPVYHPDDLIAGSRERPVSPDALPAPPPAEAKKSGRKAAKEQATTETPSTENAGAASGEIPVDAREDDAVKS